MKRYLLFDSACTQCSQIAHAVEQICEGWCEARSLREPAMQELLKQADPHWKWEPALLELEDGVVRSLTGVRLRISLLKNLGLQKTWQVFQAVHQTAFSTPGVDIGRRHLWRRSGAFIASLALGLIPFTAHAAMPSSAPPQIVVLKGQEAQQYIRVTLVSQRYKSFQAQQSSLLGQGFKFQESKATATLIRTTVEEIVFVRIPIAGGAGYSFYGEAMRYRSFQVVETLAGVFITRSDQNIAAHMWRQGKEVLNVVVTPDGKQFVQGHVVQVDGRRQVLKGAVTPYLDVFCWMGALNSCLTSMGVSAWAIGLIGVFCGVACAATIGAGCIACLMGISAISGFTMGWCIGYANNQGC